MFRPLNIFQRFYKTIIFYFYYHFIQCYSCQLWIYGVKTNCEIVTSLWHLGFPDGASGKESACQCRRQEETKLPSLGQEDPLEKEVATHSSSLAWKIPYTEEPAGL